MQKDIIRKRSSSPKLQVHNPALINAQSEQLFEDVVTKPEDWGRTVESAIGAHLMNHSHTEGFILHYWRERNDENVSFLGLLSKDEVDFVIERKGKVIGLEVKSGATQSAAVIKAFKNYANPDKVLLVGNSGIPCQDFLKINPSELF